MKSYYAFGTCINTEKDSSVELIVQGLKLLKQHINDDGTWGSEDKLDTFITTNHCVMTLLGVGFSYDSYILQRAVSYLASLDHNNQISFFWRAGTLLNIPKYKQIVQHDANYIWSNRKRIGVHPNYPLPFFLLKLVLFNQLDISFDFDVQKVIRWIVEDFDETIGWYNKSSITSMASAVLYHFDFEEKDFIINASINYLTKKYQHIDECTGFLDKNIVDDCFTIYNLYETSFANYIEKTQLHRFLQKIYNRIIKELSSNSYISSPPPFGGNISSILYPTAVSLRAIIAFNSFNDLYYINKIGNSIINTFSYFISSMSMMKNSLKPTIDKIKFDYPGKRLAFIMMPFFQNKQYDEIVIAIKNTLNKYNIVGLRADDKEYADNLFDNIMSYVYAADFGIAVFERLNDEYFNPNVSLEVGYVMGLNKQVCLLKEKTLKGLHTDLVGKLYRPFDIFNISSTIDKELTKWLQDKDFI